MPDRRLPALEEHSGVPRDRHGRFHRIPLTGKWQRSVLEVADLGVPRVNLDRALAVTAEVEDEETLSARGGGVVGAE